MHTIHFKDVPKQPFDIGIIETVLADDNKTKMHNHDFYEIFLMTDGSLKHYINEFELVMGTGDFYFVQPEDTHFFQNYEKKRAVFINVSFSKEVFDEVLFSHNLEEVRNKGGYLNTEVQRGMLEKLAVLTCGCKTEAELRLKNALCKNMIGEFLLWLLLEEGNEKKEGPAWLRNALKKMQEENNLYGGIPALIQMTGYSQEHITRCMNQYYRESPSQFINRIRVERAKQQLLTTQDTVMDISLSVGFESISYFNRIFMRLAGTTPTQYRRNTRSIV